MKKNIRYKFLILFQLLWMISSTTFAQEAAPPAPVTPAAAATGGAGGGDDILQDSIQDLSIVAGLGVGGRGRRN